MMITLHGLPISVKYQDVKQLIKQECKIHDFILDNLVADGNGSKKVRVGLTDIKEGNHLMECLDGFRMSGNVLHVMPVGKPGQITHPQQGAFDTGGFQRPVEQRLGPWVGNQWTTNQVLPHAQQNSFQHQQHTAQNNVYAQQAPRLPQTQNIRGDKFVTYQRSVQGGRYPAPHNYEMRQEKPITIMKDNFHGPSQFNIGLTHHEPDQYQGSGQNPVWSQPYQKAVLARTNSGLGKIEIGDRKYPQGDRPTTNHEKMDDFKGFKGSERFSPRRGSEYGREVSPRRSPHRHGIHFGRQMSPSGRRISPSTRHAFPGRQMSPSGRRMSPSRQTILSKRQMSPTDRRISPFRQATVSGRQMSPPGRRVSPSTRQAILSGRHMSPTERRISPSSRQAIPSGRQMSPGKRVSPSNRLAIRSGREISPPRRRVSPPNRQVILTNRQASPPGRTMSPSSRQAILSGRQISPGRRVSPSNRQHIITGRPISPLGRQVSHINRQLVPGRQMSPSRRRISPPGRRMSPSNRRMSPGRQVPMGIGIPPSGRITPSGRHVAGVPPGTVYPGSRISPSRKEEMVRGRNTMQRDATVREADSRMHHQQSPNMPRRPSPGRQTMRISPSHHEKNLEKYEDHQDVRGGGLKYVRPAYEIHSQAANQAMYSGGFRANPHGEKQYHRESPDREQRWQEKDKFSSRKIIDQRRDKAGLQKFDIPRASDHQRVAEQDEKTAGLRTRDSRSPRRDRSPLRDRFKRHSPSPRSPRRSWALEKRRSPETDDAPPPPIWPGNDSRNIEYQRHDRSQFSQRGNEKHAQIWERKQEEPRGNRQVHEDQRNFESDSIKPKWKPIAQETSRDPPRFINVDGFQNQRDSTYRRKEFGDSYKCENKDTKMELDGGSFAEPSRHGYEEARSKQSFPGRSNLYKREEFIRHAVINKDKDILIKQEELQKEIDDVYKRAVDFAIKAKIYRKSENKRDTNYDEDRFMKDSSGPQHYKAQRYGDEPPFSRDEDMRSTQNVGKFETKDSDWNNKTIKSNKHIINSAIAKEKRDRAVDEISEKMMSKYGVALSGDIKGSVHEALKLELSRTLLNMFGCEDVSFIEIVVKYNSKYTAKDEEKMFKYIMSKFSSNYRSLKRPALDDSNIPTKILRRSPESKFSKDQLPIANVTHRWNFMQPNVAIDTVPPVGVMINPPVMVPVPEPYQYVQQFPEITQPIVAEIPKNGHSLYLSKDDFQPFEDDESENLKNFLVQQLIVVTETSQGWAPDFTLNKQNCAYRYEVVTRDEQSKDWLLSLDFSEFKEFNVLVYTTEELWYERAAIWLPGHSRCRNIDPLTKLKLQNKKLEGVNIDKWKCVKKVVIEKGTRLYVDIPPSSARALEKFKMMLSYELQKVNVFLKADAVDKNAFDIGLTEPSLTMLPNRKKTTMPLIPDDPNTVNISLKHNKPLSLTSAGKIKDMLVYQLFKYHQLEGTSRTDFVKYGFSNSGYLAVVPENQESRKWICSLDIGKLNRQPVVIVGAENIRTPYIKMFVDLPRGYGGNSALACERLRQSNKGVKGINFNLWKNAKIVTDRSFGKGILEVDMDLESIETIASIKYQLDYVEGLALQTVQVTSDHSRVMLQKMISKFKAELTDSYVVANMEISSDSDNEVICCT